MFQFRIDMQSEALAVLRRIANLPVTRLQRFVGRVVAHQVKTEVYPATWTQSVIADSGWQLFKNRMRIPSLGKMPGYLTGSTYTGIQVLSYDQYQTTVGVRGKWPTQFTQMPDWTKLQKPETYEVSADYAELDNFFVQAEAIMSVEEGEALARDAGITDVGSRISEQPKPVDLGPDVRGMYMRKRRKSEYIVIGPAGISIGMRTKKSGFLEKSFPAEEMTAKRYGQRNNVDFMYLRESDAEVVLQQIGRAIDMVFRAGIKEIPGTALIPT